MSLSFTGIGSGLEVNKIVTAIVNAEKVPYQARVTSQQGDFTADISAVGSLKASLEEMTSSLSGLSDKDKYQQRSISGNDDFVSLSSDKDAEVGSYSVKVDQLAMSHKLMSAAIGSTDTVGKGTMAFKSGSNDFTIDVSDTATLSELRDQINKSNDNTSVIATIITDSDGQHLVLSSKTTGVGNMVEVTVTDDDGNNTDVQGLSQLAYSGHKYTSDTIPQGVNLGEGTIAITSNTNSFNIAVSATAPLNEIRDLINNSNDNNSVVASIITENSGDERLVLTSIDTGISDNITLSVTDSDSNNTDASGLSRLVNGAQTAGAITNVAQINKAQDAKITIDGTVVVKSNTNNFKDVIDGIDITANKVHDTSDDISNIKVSENNNNVATGLNSFIEKFNAFVDLSKQLGAASENNAGTLSGDAMLRNSMNQIRSIFSTQFDTANNSTLALSQLGIRTERNGYLSLDNDTLNEMIEQDPDAVQNFLIGSDSDSGFVNTLTQKLEVYTGKGGLIEKRIEGKESQIARLQEDVDKFNQKMASLESRLYAQYNAMDLLVANMNSTGSYLQQQLNNMPGVVKNSK
jgi:flagellar hook-associated protein 2